uniref:Reverse transcriptase domain-containing protein n=1 Tax=Leptobrachium leishanense TaxID=445787 RepID=A0A8C5PWQ4_9ANUR
MRIKRVAILFASDVPFVLQDSCVDDQGRFLFVKGMIADIVYTFATVYVTNVVQSACFARIMSKLRHFQEGVLVLAGDMNVALHPSVDTSGGTSALPLHTLCTLRRSLHDMRLVDTWRAFHPGELDYTFYSGPHHVLSRLDYIFFEQYRLDLVMEAHIHPTTWSDHAPVSVCMASPLFRPRERTWRLNVSLLSDWGAVAGTREVLTNYFEENSSSEVTRPVTWEAHKAVVRGDFMSRGTAMKKAREGQRLDLLAEIRTLELRRGGDLDAEVQDLLLKARRALNDLLSLDIKQAAARTKCFFALNENRPGKLLARILRKRRQMAYVPKIRTPGGAITLRPEEITATFREYYASLYNLSDPNPPSPGAIGDYLSANLRIHLQDGEAEQLDSPITAGEIAAALKSTKNGKSPGPDGLPAEYYREFRDLLIPHMVSTFNAVTAETPFHPQTLCATIAVLPKPGKDPAECTSYRPISLLNCDIKILARILANRLKQFLPGSGQRLLLLSTDAEKAFDRVLWPFLFQTLRTLGLGSGFLTWVQALYTLPTARIKVNGALSASFPISNGTRQGCPLSPLLFALSLEPFLEGVRRNPTIPGLQGVNRSHKVTAYADDLLFFLTDARQSLAAVVGAFEAYGKLAGLKINMSKSEILNVSVLDGEAVGIWDA